MRKSSPWVERDFPKQIVIATFPWEMPGWGYSGNANTVVAAGRIYYMPIFVDTQRTYDRIGVYCAVGDGAGGVADLRIFAYAGGVPGALVLSAGTVSTNVNGAKEIAISQQLDRGYYFLACRCDQAPTLSGPLGSQMNQYPCSGLVDVNSQINFVYVCPGVDAAYADPAPAPTMLFGAQHAFVRLRRA